MTPANINVFARRPAGKIPIKQGNTFFFDGDDPIDFEDADSTLHFFFPKDYARAVNDSATGFANQPSVRRYFYSDRGKDYMLVGVPWSWINTAPQGTLIIDPSVSPVASEDVWLENAGNNGASTILLVGKARDPWTNYPKKRTIIKFNTSSVPPTATVVNAQLKLRYYAAVRPTGSTDPWVDRWVQAHQLLRHWKELEADSLKRLSGVNWLAPRGKIGPGSDSLTADANGQFESTTLFVQSEISTLPIWKSWNLTNLTQKWVKVSGPGSFPSYGVILWATNENVNGYDLRFYSSEATNSADRPYLEVIYSTEAATKTVYFLKDHLGSIRATVLDSATAPVRGYDDYDPWGYPLVGRTKKTPYDSLQKIAKNKFTGKERDDDYGVNLDYFGARYYDWLIGRWISVDPLAIKYPSWSPYVYTLDNPIRFLDDDGRDVRNAMPLGSIMRFLFVSVITKNLTTWKSRDTKDYNTFLEHIQGKSLDQITHEADRIDRTNYSAEGPANKFKFFEDPAFPGRVIDTRHFIVIGQLGQGTLGLLKANAYGILVELGQIAKGNLDSGANREDFYSNYLGSIFFHYYYDPKSDKTFEQQLREWLEQRKREQEEKREDERKKKEQEKKEKK